MVPDSNFEGFLHTAFASYVEQNSPLEVIALATTDGFPVAHFCSNTRAFEIDTLAAAASTLCSVSNAVAQQILNKQFKVAFIETEQGNVAFVALHINERDYVLAMSAQQTMNIANLRLLITRLAKEISATERSAVA